MGGARGRGSKELLKRVDDFDLVSISDAVCINLIGALYAHEVGHALSFIGWCVRGALSVFKPLPPSDAVRKQKNLF